MRITKNGLLIHLRKDSSVVLTFRRLPLYGTNPGVGCESTVPTSYVNYDVGSWKPFLYSTTNSPFVTVEVNMENSNDF